ncbi:MULTISPECIES: DUF4240 domain-containing protein [Niallia]|uniref:DUF4240 domain-containing protein n=2 Tax=Bacillati TaxID=1783272 RepID=A0A3S2TTN5_9BACI|nr:MULTISPECIES: DUF4240 domain-containing protein [Niallia]MED4040736.1 DUF4240 domain-containing protein [Niallia taxi]MED4057558.1 DUF4240 domain-containing protein [Niallia taxi]MED4122339.1 DUF4240 domain-containing protein [Niallia taxi]RVT56349.1 DUF4240 domain-containing protein [Niallia taxi]GKU85310.1 hypothetical protein NCCP28_47060 [Niallia sp. NCCP-28]
MHLTLGDIFAVPLPNKFFAAIKIINIVEKDILVKTTPYIDTFLPSITNPILKETLRNNRFFYNNTPAIKWVNGEFPKEFVFIGNIPLTDQERNWRSSTFSETWSYVGYDVYDEWRYIHDREALEKEIEEQEQKDMIIDEDNKKHKDVKLMNNSDFWKLMSLIHSTRQIKEGIQLLITELAKLKVKEIKLFEETLSFKLYLLDTKEHACNIGEHSFREEKPNTFSVDLFLYARCAAVSKGEKIYNEILDIPKLMPKNEFLEELLDVASEAYEEKKGKEFIFNTTYDKETFSNKEGWS